MTFRAGGDVEAAVENGDSADEKMHALQSKVEPALDRLSVKAQALANQGIGMAYVPSANAKIGGELEIEIRGQKFPAVIEKKPLYKKP